LTRQKGLCNGNLNYKLPLTLRCPVSFTLSCVQGGGGVKLLPGVSRVLWHLGRKFQRL